MAAAWLMAIDTTAEVGSLALLRDGHTVEETPLQSPEGFGHLVFGAIEAMLARHELQASAIVCFAGATGPGSFTGVRVGLTVVKGLGEAVGCPVVGVSNLQALAAFGTSAIRAVVLDARRTEVYGAVYDAALRCVHEETVIRFADWLQSLPAEAEVIAQNFTPFADALPDRKMTVAPRALAAAMGQIAWKEFSNGRAVDPAALDANYVRRSDAELLWKEQ